MEKEKKIKKQKERKTEDETAWAEEEKEERRFEIWLFCYFVVPRSVLSFYILLEFVNQYGKTIKL